MIEKPAIGGLLFCDGFAEALIEAGQPCRRPPRQIPLRPDRTTYPCGAVSWRFSSKGSTMSQPETIAAIATAPGAGGVGIVRLSGARSHAIAQAVAGLSLAPRHARYARFLGADGDTIDDG